MNSICISEDHPFFTIKGRFLLSKDGSKLIRYLFAKDEDEGDWFCDEPPAEMAEEETDSDTAIIPDGVTEICDFAFGLQKELVSVTIPDSVTRIGDRAFAYCDNLTTLFIPDGVTEIADEAFWNVKHICYYGKVGYDFTLWETNTYWGADSLTHR